MTDESVPAAASPVMAQPTEAERRRLRQAQKLRENLQRRKQQLRSRRAGDADETEGLPGASPGSAAMATSSQAGD
ncbi:hypothetical protein [Rhizobium sp. RU36D]|uniref:hypothetical protein n=1 Tax=Rhizobium sp. RU36D TaxID=1907415 RepID=UPI0009D90FB7|nr:hypothetical protein [Rhizobium sp. RU36D]SMC87525.1 hypothetical protein SAMN05880593_108206 [Rhizobium sp. RU36D]